MLRNKRLLYLTANRLTAYSRSRGGLAVDAAFERNDAGLAAFSAYLAGSIITSTLPMASFTSRL